MSVVTVAEAKLYLRVVHNADDALILQLLEEAEDECKQYLDRGELPKNNASCPDECDTAAVEDAVSDSADLAPGLRRGILFIVQASYEGKDAEEIAKLRKAAETCWAPFRCNWGA